MSFGRFSAKNVIPGYRMVSIGKKVIDNGLVDGIKEEFIETVKDNPVTSPVYNMGKDEGKKEGYIQASNIYEEKFYLQAQKFIEQKQLLKKDLEEYEELLGLYEQKIDELNSKIELSNEEKKYLQDLLMMERKLLKLR